jgi:hypothetical protein
MRILTLLFLATALWAQPKASGEPITVDDLVLLLGMGVPDTKVIVVATNHCLDQPLNDASRQLLQAKNGSAMLVAALNNVCVRPPTTQLNKAITCPEAYTNDPQRKGCVNFPRGEKYFQLPRPETGECVVEAEVDDVVEFAFQGALILYEVSKGTPPVVQSASCNQPLPDTPVIATLVREKGRGRTAVVAQPDAANQHSLRIRVEDTARRADAYRLRITWKNAPAK